MAENISFDPSKKIDAHKAPLHLSKTDESFGNILEALDIDDTEGVSNVNAIDVRDMNKPLTSAFYNQVNNAINNEFKIQGLG